MPRYPSASSSATRIRGAVYSSLAHRLSTYPGEVYPLHVGDTWMEPPAGCCMEDLAVEDFPGMHRYAPTRGMPELIDAVVERIRERCGVAVQRENILITGGATGGLAMVMGAIVEPGDEVMILAPHWPLIAGMVRAFHAVAEVVPFLGLADSPESALTLVEERLSPRTVALYLNTPNNPTGRTIPRPWLEALVEWAVKHELWIVADEVYEDYQYQGEHTHCLTLAREQTLAAYSFSKAYGMAGNRCGYVVGPAALLDEIHKVHTHIFYSAPTASQIAALRILQGAGDSWLREAQRRYEELGRNAAALLGAPRPEGSAFLFLDVEPCLDERGLEGFLEDCADQGVFLAPGPSFGPYPHHVRICYTSADPRVVTRGVEALARIIQSKAP